MTQDGMETCISGPVKTAEATCGAGHARRIRWPRLAQALLALAVAVACPARGAVTEKITLHQGGTIDNLQGVTFDGQAFAVPGKPSLPKAEVQAIDFRAAGQERQQATAGVAAELSAEAKAQLPRAAALAKQYPGTAGVVLLDDGEFVLHKDGTDSYRYHFAGVVLKEERKAWAQLSMGFVEGRSRVRLLFARAVGRDGAVRSLSDDDLKTGSPSEEMQFFNPNHKVRSGVIPGVEPGCVVEYCYEYENYNPEDRRLFSPSYVFQSGEPIVLSRARVLLPKDVSLNHMTRKFPDAEKAKPVVAETADTRTYTWQLENVAPLTPEPAMPPEHDLVPILETSIFKDWADVWGLLAKLQQARMQPTPQIEAKVKELTQDAQAPDDKVARLYHWVQSNTHYISIKGSLGAGFSGHTAQETFDNRYGDCTDKSILFCTMLKGIGVQAYPIILTTNDFGLGVTEIPTLSGNHCISELTMGDRDFYLDTTAEDYRYPYFRADDHGAYAFNAIRGDFKPIPVPPPSDNRRASHLDVELSAKGDAVVKTRNEYNGTIEAGVRSFWKSVREDERKQRMNEYVNSLSPGAVLDTFAMSDLDDLAKPLTMSIDYSLPGHAVRAKDLMYLTMPTLKREYPEAALDTRDFPVQYMTTEERALEIDLKLPPKFHAKWLPPPLDVTNAYLEYHGKYEERDGHIVLTETMRRLQRLVPPTDYPAFRDALRAIAAFEAKEVFLTGKGSTHE